MKLRRFFTLITCVGLTGAVGDMTVDVKRGENIILPDKNHVMGDVNRVMLWRRYENGTQAIIFRYCSNKETKRGCPAIDDNRVQLGSENVSVIIRDARATDAGRYIVEVIGDNTIREEFTVVFTESSGGQFTVIIGVVTGVIGVVIVGSVFAVYLRKKKNLKKLDSCDSTVDSEVADSQSSITGGQSTRLDVLGFES
ncbi:HEPACAM family member 2 [Labeo rohita]|uniref:HEPACAM family member 2 n=1 Tax=Labeo rohita TaxID=84645 RepID=A0ABQ8L2S1_LABRO|nr:HEPACAM family member 2 [Labeo rohita]